MRTRFLAVSGHYRKEGDGVTLELFGRCEDNRSITALYHDFWPYFYIVEPGEEVRKDLGNDPMVRDLREKSLWEAGEERNCLRVEITYPFDVPKYRKKWQERGYRILAADIPFIYRYFYDLDLGTYLEIEGQEVNTDRYSTDLVIDISDIKAVEPFDVSLKVLSFDIENSIKTGEIYTIGYSTSGFPLSSEDLKGSSIALDPKEGWGVLEGERKMIDDLSSVIRDEDPDIITGYNIDGYDIPHVLKRDEILEGKGLNWGRDGGMIEKVGYRTWKMKGRVVVDAWWEAKKTFRPKKETLMAVSNLLLGEGKDDIDTSRIEEEWKNRREDVIRYCVKDSVLALRILNKTSSVQRGVELAYVARLPLVDVLSGTTSTLIDSILIRKADRAGIGIPLTRHEKKRSKIEGAYVHAVEPGLYDWVVVLDFRSMYPSLMIEKNICFTTFTRDVDAGNKTPLDDVFYLPKDRRMGLVPDILQDLMDRRQNAKSRMRSAKTDDESRFLDGLQEAIKVLMNSFYGVFASYFYRFTNRSIGASITAFAREAIMDLISTIEGEGVEVIYSDTDSVFLRSPHDNAEDTIEFSKKLARRFSRDGVVLEFEKVLNPFFTHGKKKRYVGMQIWPEEKLIVRGYEMRRTDSFDLQSGSLTRMFEYVLDRDIDGALLFARETIRKCREEDVETQSLVISRTVKEVEEDRIRSAYKNPDSLSNIQALRKTLLLGIEVVPGMKVSWIVVDAKTSPQRVEPFVDGRDFEYRPDYRYYTERLASTLSRVTEVFDVSEKDLLTSGSQTSLFDSFNSEGREEEEKKIDAGHIPGNTVDERSEKAANTGSNGRKDVSLDMWM